MTTEIEGAINYDACAEIGQLLTRDQCVNTFRNTQEAIVLWLCGCTPRARKSIREAIGKADDELLTFNR